VAEVSQQGVQGREGATSWLTVSLCFVIALFEGFDLQAAGVAAPRLAPALGLDQGQLGLFFSASTFGLMFGAAVGGRLSDHFGRKAVLIGSIAVFGLMSIATAQAHDVNTLVLFRFLTGVGLGGALPNLLALAAENTAHGRRNTSVASLYAGMPTGGALVSLASLFGAADDWRIVFYVGGLAPLIAIPLLWFFLPDSRELKAAQEAPKASGRGFVFALAKEGRAGRTILLWGSFFLALVTMYVLLNWLPSLLVERGLSRPDASWVQMSFNIFGALASVATGVIMDRFSLSKVVAGVFVGAAVGLVVLWLAPVALPVSLLVGGLVGATISMTQALLYALAPSTYPTEVRGTGVGAAVAVGRFGSTVGPLIAGALLSAGAAPQQILMVLIPIIAVSGIAAMVLSRINEARLGVAAAAA
jgi:AAHS family 3-hydroxyphenylpropionic acid transporter